MNSFGLFNAKTCFILRHIWFVNKWFGDNIISKWLWDLLLVIVKWFQVLHQPFGVVDRMFANGLEDWGSKMVLDASLLSIISYGLKVSGAIQGKE